MIFVTIELFSIVNRLKEKNQRIDKQSEKKVIVSPKVKQN